MRSNLDSNYKLFFYAVSLLVANLIGAICFGGAFQDAMNGVGSWERAFLFGVGMTLIIMVGGGFMIWDTHEWLCKIERESSRQRARAQPAPPPPAPSEPFPMDTPPDQMMAGAVPMVMFLIARALEMSTARHEEHVAAAHGLAEDFVAVLVPDEDLRRTLKASAEGTLETMLASRAVHPVGSKSN